MDKILDFLKEEPLSIEEIYQMAGYDIEDIKNKIKLLIEDNKIGMITFDKKEYYFILHRIDRTGRIQVSDYFNLFNRKRNLRYSIRNYKMQNI